jgi:hypothetical protein
LANSKLFRISDKIEPLARIFITKITICNSKINQTIPDLIKFLPNLKTIELSDVRTEKDIMWNFQPTEVEYITIEECSFSVFGLLSSLEKCKIKGAKLQFPAQQKFQDDIVGFLKAQQSNLKKLTINSKELNIGFLDKMEELQLEHIYILTEARTMNFPSKILVSHLKSSELNVLELSNEVLKTICKLQNLECLELNCVSLLGSELNDIYK